MLNNMLLASASEEKNFIEDLFSCYLYTGNGSTQTITNGIDLAGKGGLVWVKARNIALPNYLIDTDRGGNKILRSESTSGNSNQTNPSIIFNNNGFSLDDSAGASVNYAGSPASTYASWTFRKAPKFFDVVTYTGNGATNRQISHSLGATPGMLIVKCTSTSASWVVWHRSLGGTNYNMYLNGTFANAANGDLSPNGLGTITSTSFCVSADYGLTNTNGATYVAYLFAHDTTADGVIQCGTFSASSATTVNLGWEPQYILLKQSSGAQSWYVVDTMRGLSYRNFMFLQPNTADGEADAGVVIEPTPTGFTFKGANLGMTGGQTYVYMAIRRGPMRVPTDATKVFKPVTRNGTNTTPWVASGAGFPPDMAIMSGRNLVNFSSPSYYQHSVIDRLRNATEHIQTVNSDFEGGGWGAGHILNMDGYDGKYSSDQYYYNATGGTYVDIYFRRAPGFFDVVCYKATNVANRQINHNLGVAPELMIVKDRTAAGTWAVYTPLGAMGLNSDAATAGYNGAAFFGNGTSIIAPTATVFTVGLSMNWSTDNYVAYLFSSCPGVSKIGSYTGNGSSQDIACGFTNGARLVLIKRTDLSGDWYIWDTARGIVTANDPHLSLNAGTAEVTTNDTIDPLSSGFTVNQVAATNVNVSSATYIYLAIA